MPSNYWIFSTGGDWDSTTLYNNGDEYMADRLSLNLQTSRDEFGNFIRGGIADGGEMTALVVPQGTGQEIGVFPGKIDLEFPGHRVTILNDTPQFAIEFTRVVLDGTDVTDSVVEFVTEIDAVNNIVKAYIVLYKPHLIAADEVATINFL